MKTKVWTWIFWIIFILFIADLFIPDPVPLVDEIVLGVISAFSLAKSRTKELKRALKK